MGVIQFKYSKFWTSIFVISFLGIILISTSEFIRILQYDNAQYYSIFFIPFELLLVFSLYYVCRRYFIPAFKNSIALELNNNAIIDNINNKTFYWKNISDISYHQGKSGTHIVIDFIDKSTISKKDTLIYYLKKNKYYLSLKFNITIFCRR